MNISTSAISPVATMQAASQMQTASTHKETTESAATEAKESAKVQVAEGEVVKPAPGRLSIYA